MDLSVFVRGPGACIRNFLGSTCFPSVPREINAAASSATTADGAASVKGSRKRHRRGRRGKLLVEIIEYYAQGKEAKMYLYASPRELCYAGHLIRKSIKRLLLGNFFSLSLVPTYPTACNPLPVLCIPFYKKNSNARGVDDDTQIISVGWYLNVHPCAT